MLFINRLYLQSKTEESLELKGRFPVLVKTMYGLEEILAEELKQSGIKEIEIQNRAVSCIVCKEELYRLNIKLRTALRIIIPLYEFEAWNEGQFYKRAKKYNWTSLFSMEKTFAIESVVHSKWFKHSKFAALRLKDAIADQFTEKFGKRPDVNTETPDFLLQLHIGDQRCTVSLDSSGNSLHKRGYRLEKNKAPLNEVLAAGMILKSGWDKKSNFLDPMCGSGTILIEAAMMAANIPPGINRKFGFMKWDSFDSALFEKAASELKSKIKDPGQIIFGSDIDADAITVTKANMKRAGVDNIALIKKTAFENRIIPANGGFIITNPPYGERLSVDKVKEFYSKIGDKLKQKCSGYKAWILSSNNTGMKNIGLRPSKKELLMNGPLECKYYMYDIYDGSKKRKYKETDR